LSQGDEGAASKDIGERKNYDPAKAGFRNLGTNAPQVNMLAVAAPELRPNERGTRYSKETLTDLFSNSYRGFRMVKENDSKNGRPTRIVSGLWGAGAFGHSSEMSIAVQYLAARLAHVDQIEFTGTKDEQKVRRAVIHVVDQIIQSANTNVQNKKSISVEDVLTDLHQASAQLGWATQPSRPKS
jgi:hypothetical protein